MMITSPIIKFKIRITVQKIMSEHAWISGGCPFKGRRIDSRGNIKYKGKEM
jgi:hypothetical protein